MDCEGLTTGLKERAKHLFFLSDLEGKGFIVRRDMQRMRSEVPLPPEQLEAVFDSLDREQNGFLTLQQFLQGFGSFLSSGAPSSKTETVRSTPETDDQCMLLIERLSSRRVLHTPPLRHLCHVIVREGSPQIQVELEAALRQLEEDVRRLEAEQSALQEAARTREEAHDEQVRKLFEEMESNLIEEKVKMASQCESRLSQQKRQMEAEIAQRDHNLQEVTSQRDHSNSRLQLALASVAAEQRTSSQLSQEKEELSACCARQSSELEQLRARLSGARSLDPSRQRGARTQAAMGYRLAQTMIRQEQGLLQQLVLLRSLAETLEGNKSTQGRQEQEAHDRMPIDRPC